MAEDPMKSDSCISVNKDVTTNPASKRRNLGRNARRRRKKVLAIEAAAEAAAAAMTTVKTTTTTPTTTTTTKRKSCCVDTDSENSRQHNILPKDRAYIWPAVNDLCELTESDKHSLISQLGWLPGNALKVSSRLNDYFPSYPNDDSPLVVQLYPLVLRDESDSTKSHRKRKRRMKNGANATANTNTNAADTSVSLVEPFPTIFWVTHPRIRALISKLELTTRPSSSSNQNNNKNTSHQNGKNPDGTTARKIKRTIQQFEEQLQNDKNALTSMRIAHEKYGQERFDIITEQDWKWIQEQNWQEAFAISKGVAGIRNPASIKCLHAHAAHYWSGCIENKVGKWVSEEIQSLLTDSL